MTNRLLEFIDADELPVRYGGRARDPYDHLDTADFLTVPRMGECKKLLALPRDTAAVLDLYFKDGVVHVKIESEHCGSNGTRQQHMLLQRSVTPPEDGRPERHLFNIPAAAVDRKLVLSFANPAMLVVRYVTVVYTTSTTTTTAPHVVAACSSEVTN